MLELHEAIKIVKRLSLSGPPVCYHASDDTYDCTFCGPTEFTIAEAFDWRCHGPTCAWRLAVEFCRTPEQVAYDQAEANVQADQAKQAQPAEQAKQVANDDA